MPQTKQVENIKVDTRPFDDIFLKYINIVDLWIKVGEMGKEKFEADKIAEKINDLSN